MASGHAEALQLLGTAELQLGRAQDATNHLEQALRSLPGRPDVLGNLAHAYLALGRWDEAYQAFQKANRLDAQNIGFRVGMANARALGGHLDEAETLLRKVTERHPDEVLGWFNLGNVLRDQRRHRDAADCFAKALDLQPQYADAHNNLGSALHALNFLEDAEQEYRACLALVPTHAHARLNLASVLIDAGRFADAEAEARPTLEQTPHDALAHIMLGAALSHQGRTREALQSYQSAARLAPADGHMAETLAMALAATGMLDEALTEFDRALQLDPQLESVHRARGVALLAAGRFVEGWKGYLHRAPAADIDGKTAEISRTQELPDRLSGASLLLQRYQGLGDELFCLRYAPALAKAGAKLIYVGSSKLRSLLGRVECLSVVLEAFDPVPLVDATLSIKNLPMALHAHAVKHMLPDDAEKSSAWLDTPPPPLRIPPQDERVAEMQARLRSAGDPPYIGLTWRAGTLPREQTGTQWNLFKTFEPTLLANTLSGVPGTLLALQRHPVPGEIERCSAAFGRTVHDFTNVNEDLESMLALLSLIDEYIAVSNTNVHLRASAGRHARVLAPQPPEWRWMLSGNGSPWFPGFSVYRQSVDGDWSEALASLARDLRRDA